MKKMSQSKEQLKELLAHKTNRPERPSMKIPAQTINSQLVENFQIKQQSNKQSQQTLIPYKVI